MKEGDREERGTGMKVKKQKNKNIPLLPLPTTKIAGLAQLYADATYTTPSPHPTILLFFFIFLFKILPENKVWTFMQMVPICMKCQTLFKIGKSIIIFFFFQRTGFEISCKLSTKEINIQANVNHNFLGRY